MTKFHHMHPIMTKEHTLSNNIVVLFVGWVIFSFGITIDTSLTIIKQL
jgi:hypothetical protein